VTGAQPDPVTEELFLIRAAVDRGAVMPATIRLLLAAVEKVLELHAPVSRGRVMNCCRGCEEENGEFHEDCCHEWPCPSYEAISQALLSEAEQ